MEINKFKSPDESSVGGLQLKTKGTLSFMLHNSDYQLLLEALGDIFQLHTDGLGDVPKSFTSDKFWA